MESKRRMFISSFYLVSFPPPPDSDLDAGPGFGRNCFSIQASQVCGVVSLPSREPGKTVCLMLSRQKRPCVILESKAVNSVSLRQTAEIIRIHIGLPGA